MPKKTKIQTQDITLTEADVARLIGEVAEAQTTHDATLARMNEQLDGIRAAYEPELQQHASVIQAKSLQIEAWVRANSAQFTSPRSRAFARGEIGLELGKWAVSTLKGVTQKLAVKRLLKLRWGRAFVRQPEPVLNKELLLQHREKLTPKQLKAAGIEFTQDERFFLKLNLDAATAPVAVE